jgi:hypothetical protein
MVTSSTPGCYAREPDSRQADLILQDGVFYLLLVVGLPLIEAEGVLGIVLGVKNIVSDSMGETFSGAELNRILIGISGCAINFRRKVQNRPDTC